MSLIPSMVFHVVGRALPCIFGFKSRPLRGLKPGQFFLVRNLALIHPGITKPIKITPLLLPFCTQTSPREIGVTTVATTGDNLHRKTHLYATGGCIFRHPTLLSLLLQTGLLLPVVSLSGPIHLSFTVGFLAQLLDRPGPPALLAKLLIYWLAYWLGSGASQSVSSCGFCSSREFSAPDPTMGVV